MSVLPPDLRPGTTFDLHLHTTASDGRYGLDEVLSRCAAGGLDVVAITDHDLAPDLQPGPRDVDGRTLHIIAGAEVSGVHDGHEYHLLVYFPGDVPEGFRTFCRAQCLERTERFLDTVRSLALDLLPPEEAKAVTRLHLAHAMVEAGIVGTRQEAFSRFLGERHGHVPPFTLAFTDAIRIARSFGGITSWAHPPRRAVEAYLPTFAAAGLHALELHRPFLRSADRKVLKKLARRNGLFATGGSDWHGWSGSDPGLFRVQADQLTGLIDTLIGA